MTYLKGTVSGRFTYRKPNMSRLPSTVEVRKLSDKVVTAMQNGGLEVVNISEIEKRVTAQMSDEDIAVMNVFHEGEKDAEQ